MVGGTGDKSGRGLGSLAPPAQAWTIVGRGWYCRPTPLHFTAAPSGRLLQHSAEPCARLVPSHPSPHGGSRVVSQTQATLTLVLGSSDVLKLSLRRMAPLRAVGGRGRRKRRQSRGSGPLTTGAVKRPGVWAQGGPLPGRPGMGRWEGTGYWLLELHSPSLPSQTFCSFRA